MQTVNNSSLNAVSSEEKELFYSTRKPERDIEIGCIGHLRADFGRDGNEFWSTWTDHCPELKTQAFKNELDAHINNLRDNGILKNRAAMSAYCGKNQQSMLTDGRGSYGFKINTKSYIFYLRCNASPGDYNLYLYAYERTKLKKCFPAIAEVKPTLMERLEANKQKAVQQGQPAAHKIDEGIRE
jgi:hypothetical protein